MAEPSGECHDIAAAPLAHYLLYIRFETPLPDKQKMAVGFAWQFCDRFREHENSMPWTKCADKTDYCLILNVEIGTHFGSTTAGLEYIGINTIRIDINLVGSNTRSN